MTDKQIFWFATIEDCTDAFIVKAKTKVEAISKVYNELNEIYPPKYMKERGYRPYYKKDIDCQKLDKLLGEYGIYWL